MGNYMKENNVKVKDGTESIPFTQNLKRSQITIERLINWGFYNLSTVYQPLYFNYYNLGLIDFIIRSYHHNFTGSLQIVGWTDRLR